MLGRCDVWLSRIVAEREVRYQRGDDYDEDIDLSPDIAAGRIQVFEVELAEVVRFRASFDPLYVEEMDDGETESLAYLMSQSDGFSISSGDAIVYRVLGNLGRGDQGVSLEEVLQRIGLGRSLDWPYSKRFREKFMQQGIEDMFRGRGRKH